MRNDGGDEPFSGQIPGNQIFNNTHQIMAFHVDTEFDVYVQNKAFSAKYHHPNNLVQIRDPNRIRDVGLFEGSDEFGRLQPLLGTAGPATDAEFNAINWPDDQSKCGSTCQMGSCEPGCGPGMFGNNGCPADCEGCPYFCAGLVGQMEGSIAWHSPTTENPVLGDVEEWDIWNLSADAHPIHLHLVHFEVISRHNIKYDTAIPLDPTDPDFDPLVDPPFTPAGDGIYLELQPIVQHTGAIGTGRKIVFPTAGNCDGPDGKCYSETSVTDYPPGFIDALVEGNRKDTVTALPGQVTKIRARFDKPGRYVWHCHILSHEDHEMMRVLYVGTGADARADHENV
jgi:spore coat protein A